MPILTHDDQPLGPVRRLPALPEEPDGPGVLEALGASFRINNEIGSAIVEEDNLPSANRWRLDPDFDPFAPESLAGYEQYADRFIYAYDKAEADTVKRQIDRERRDRAVIDAAGGMGLATDFVAGMSSPLTLLPIGAAASGGKALVTAGRTAVAGAVAAGIGEAALHSTQQTRTVEESYYTIGGAALLSGILGGAVPLALRPDVAALSERVRKDLAPSPSELPDPLAPIGHEPSTAGAAQVRNTTMAQETQIGAAGLEKATAFMTPLTRLLSSNSLEARRTVQELVDVPQLLAKNAEGIATPISVETRMRFYEGHMGTAMQETNRLFVQYRKGKANAGRLDTIGLQVRDAVRGREGRSMKFHEFLAEVGRAMRREDKADVPEVAEAAAMWRRTVFDPIKASAIKQGLLPEDVSVDTALSYFSRLYRYDLITKRRAEFRQRIVDWLGTLREKARTRLDEREEIITSNISAATRKGDEALAKKQADKLEKIKDETVIARLEDGELADIADQVIDNILSTPTGRTAHEATKLNRGPLKERTFHIEDELIEDFLVSDVEIVARHYIRSTAADVELAKQFGSPDLEGALTRTRDEYARRIANANEKTAEKLAKQRDRDLRDLIALRDRLRGTYAAPADPTNVFSRASRLARNWNFVRLLGGVAISSIPDIGRVVMTAGLFNSFKSGVVPLVSNWKALKLAAREAQLAGTAWELVLDSRAFGLAEIGDDFGRFSDTRLERGMQGLADSFGLVSLMSPWTQAMKTFASAVIGTKILDATLRVAAGKATKADIRNLAASGIEDWQAAKIARQYRRHGRKEGTVKIADTALWEDRQSAEAFRAALQKEVEVSIVTPGAGDKPLWMSTELGKLIGQFRSFAFSATQRVLIRGLQQRDAATLNGAAIMFALGMGVYYLKSKIAGIETSDDPAQWAVEGVDRSGLLGIMWDVNGIAEKLTAGVVGASGFTGHTLSRYQTRNAVGALLGPSFGLGSDAFNVVAAGAQGDIRLSDVRAARRLLPLQNLFYLRGLLNAGQEELAEEAGVK